MNHNQGKPFEILLVAVVILAMLSLVSWSSMTGGALKDFNLLGDLFPTETPRQTVNNAETYIDPDLLALQEEEDSLPADELSDTIISTGTESDTVPSLTDSADRQSQTDNYHTQPAEIPAEAGDIEDYTIGKTGLENLRRALRDNGSARIAMLGDSYIEGDIFSQDIRRMLQEKYGGGGVGYMPVFSNISGFRTSIRHTCSGWTKHDFRDSGRKYATLPGVYFTPDEKGSTTIKGSSKYPTGAKWNRSRLLYIAPTRATVTIKCGDSDAVTHTLEASDEVQAIELEGETGSIQLNSESPDLIILGLYLDNHTGIALDNMSIRGYAGIRHNSLSTGLASQMRRYVDYDLIILEYGMNAISPGQTNYNAFAKALEKSINRIRECYPEADILIMGVGDRGEKNGTEIHSMNAVSAMIGTQRKLAQKLGLLFWDTRAAMGGEDAVVEWSKSRDINKDYIHLSAKGGKRLGTLFVNSLIRKLDD